MLRDVKDFVISQKIYSQRGFLFRQKQHYILANAKQVY